MTDIERAMRSFDKEQSMLRFNGKPSKDISRDAKGLKHWKSRKRQLSEWVKS